MLEFTCYLADTFLDSNGTLW